MQSYCISVDSMLRDSTPPVQSLQNLQLHEKLLIAWYSMRLNYTAVSLCLIIKLNNKSLYWLGCIILLSISWWLTEQVMEDKRVLKKIIYYRLNMEMEKLGRVFIIIMEKIINKTGKFFIVTGKPGKVREFEKLVSVWSLYIHTAITFENYHKIISTITCLRDQSNYGFIIVTIWTNTWFDYYHVICVSQDNIYGGISQFYTNAT